MQVIKTREFRANQKKYYDLATKEKVIIRRGRQSFALVHVEDDELTVTPELQVKIDKARAEIRAGKCITLKTHDDVARYFSNR